MNFKKINNIAGWLIFAVAFSVYLLTMERTVSFWDCGEFLSTAAKLEVGHPPGAPLFMMMGRMFAMLAPSKALIPTFVNSMSALMSGLTILFLFWSITHFARKFFTSNRLGEDLTQGNITAIIGAGIVGALAYTFSDTFWFSAVEAEVYATSSCFTAFVFWAILKWEDNCDAPGADKWLVLISYMVGLSVGVHLLSLLVIPTIALIYYFKRYEIKTSGAIIAFIIGGLILALVQYGIIQYIPIFASKFELLFVNSFGLPLNSGAIFFVLLFGAALGYLLLWSKKKGRYILHLATLCLMFVSIGYIFSYIPTIIRAKAGVSINMNNPDNVMSLVPYLQRTQYGSVPLVYGQDFDANFAGNDGGSNIYAPVTKDGKTSYEVVGVNNNYTWDKNRVFPRLWNTQKADQYRAYLGMDKNDEATSKDNLNFFFQYQMNWMFWRYFMWNYVGRQNDYQGTNGEPEKGNWISGIKPIDKFFGKGDVDKMSPSFKDNKARNQLYFLPFALGLIGLFFQFKNKKLDGYIVLSLFFFTGIAVQLYINNDPAQPRERDYQYIASYPFAIWIGIGVIAIREWLQKVIKSSNGSAVLATLLCIMAVPVLMGFQEWDDHDRSQKTWAHDHAFNMLSSCDSNAILFVNGDNDTYPLWYIQEVEGFRTDVRIINVNILSTTWQVQELFKEQNNAAPVPMIWQPKDVVKDDLEIIGYKPDARIPLNKNYTIEDVIHYIVNPQNRTQAMDGSGQMVGYMPTLNLVQPLDKTAIINSGLVPASDSAFIPNELVLNLKGKNNFQLGDLALLNVVAANAKSGWKRPIYFSDATTGIGLDSYLQSEGVLQKLVPEQKPTMAQGLPTITNLDKDIKLFTQTFTFGKANGKSVYYDEKNKALFPKYFWASADLANALSLNNRKADAIKVLDNIINKISQTSYPYEMVVGYDYRLSIPMIIDAYYRAGAQDKARKIANIMSINLNKNANYYFGLSDNSKNGMLPQLSFYLQTFAQVAQVAARGGDKEMADKWIAQVNDLAQRTGLAAQQSR